MQTLSKTLPAISLPAIPPDGLAQLTASQRRRKMAILRKRREVIEGKQDALGRDAWHEPGDTIRLERDAINTQLEALETLGDGGPRLTVTLDDYASTIIRRHIEENPEFTPEDIANGCLSFTLGAEDDHGLEEIDKAAARRAARFNGKEAR